MSSSFAIGLGRSHSITSSARTSSGSGTSATEPRILNQAEHAVSHRHDPLHQPPLLEPEIHVHLAVHRHRCGKILVGVLRLAGTAVESA